MWIIARREVFREITENEKHGKPIREKMRVNLVCANSSPALVCHSLVSQNTNFGGEISQ